METLRKPDDEVVERFVRDIVAAVHPLRIILFGSAARGDTRVESDVDFPGGHAGRYQP